MELKQYKIIICPSNDLNYVYDPNFFSEKYDLRKTSI